MSANRRQESVWFERSRFSAADVACAGLIGGTLVFVACCAAGFRPRLLGTLLGSLGRRMRRPRLVTSIERKLDETIEDSFPASDPPSSMRLA